MPLPTDFSWVTITGTFYHADGTPATGTITAMPSVVFSNATTGVAVDRAVRTAVLDEDGTLVDSADGESPWVLAATNDPTTTPTGATYDFEAHLDTGHIEFAAILDYATPTVRFVDLVPLADPGLITQYGVTAVQGDPDRLIAVTTANGVATVRLDVTGATAGQVPTWDGTDADWATPAQGGHLIADEGTALPAQPTLNFIGAGVTATNNAGASRSDVTIPGGVTAVTGTAPITSTGGTTPAIGITAASTSAVGAVQLATPSSDVTAGHVVQASDARLSDSRPPSGSASGDLTGTYPSPTLAAAGTAGTYAYPASVTTDTKGRVTAATAGGAPPALSSSTPLVESGAGSAGSGTTASRGDHVHPADAAAGTVTSVALTGDGTVFNSSVTGSPVTTTGTLAPSLHTQAAHAVLVGPTSGGAAAPTFRVLAAADLPTTTVTPGAYTNTNLTVDAQGRLTAASNGSGGGVTLSDNNPQDTGTFADPGFGTQASRDDHVHVTGLPANVALLDAAQTFTAAQTIQITNPAATTVLPALTLISHAGDYPDAGFGLSLDMRLSDEENNHILAGQIVTKWIDEAAGATYDKATIQFWRRRGGALRQALVIDDSQVNSTLVVGESGFNAVMTPVLDSSGIQFGRSTHSGNVDFYGGSFIFHVVGAAATVLPLQLNSTTQVGVLVKAINTATGNLFEARNVSDVITWAIGADGNIRTNNAAAATIGVGTIADKLPIYNNAGTLLGYIPIYATIT